tara:strand:- start:41 stop:886 length:846 start_codon:yes stop_codon:yes gene_type:complete
MIRLGIIGTGNIGTDLLLKLIKTKDLKPIIFVGRREDSTGILLAKKKSIRTSALGINFFIKNPKFCDIVYDCTNAFDAEKHAEVFKSQGIKVIDLTPAKIGSFCVPSIKSNWKGENINMITCGGQASIPMLSLVSKYSKKLEYIEVVSQIASKSAGMATRINIDNYIETTENAIVEFTGTKKCKVILNLNPAKPEVNMQTTMFVKANSFKYEPLVHSIYKKIMELQTYIKNYELVMPPVINDGILVLSVRVKGTGDFLPEYAGNLDIINCAAIEITKNFYE